MTLQIPRNLTLAIDAHQKWLSILDQAQELVAEDSDLQDKAKKGFRLKERSFPPEFLGRNYVLYCSLINKMYDAYLNSVHLQRAPYMLEIIAVFLKRLYELRNELVHLIVNDYVYMDAALVQLRLLPTDVEIVIPFHFPLESRSESAESLLQKMWTDAVKRKNEPPIKEKSIERKHSFFGDEVDQDTKDSAKSDAKSQQSVQSITEEYVRTLIIQRCERYRLYYVKDCRNKNRTRKMYSTGKYVEAPLRRKIKGAKLIQKVYRNYMKMKRQNDSKVKQDMLIGLVPDPFNTRLNLEEENKKIYERRRKIRMELHESYKKELEKENKKLILFKRNNQIDDITDHINAWFKEWYYDYGFFPEYPYDVEGGTLLLLRGEYPTVQEKIEEDEKYEAATKGKTAEQLKLEKEQAKLDTALKAETEREQKKRETEQLFKLKCNPLADVGYKVESSDLMDNLRQALQKYRASWSLYDSFPPNQCGDNIYGYLKSIMNDDLMCQLHQDCRIYVDDLMRADLKLLVQIHQMMYKSVGLKYPKQNQRKKPKPPPLPKPLNIDDNMQEGFEELFDLGIISKPKAKIKNIYGDSNYAAYELNLRDPFAEFPPPGYGDIKTRLILSCVMGSGIQPGAKRNKSVMLVGPERNGKSFLVDCVAGELNAIKIDISPEVFSAVVEKPAKVLNQVFLAARAFQPCVIYMRNIERMFLKKASPLDKILNTKPLKSALPKLLKTLPNEDKVILIATCSNPFDTQAKPMVSLFNEVILVPRTDYSTVQQYFHQKLQSIRSMPRDYCVQSLAQLLQGYGFGVIIELFHKVMTPERIVRLNITPLSPTEFLEPLLEKNIEPTTKEDYKEYADFFIENSFLKTERLEYDIINRYRDVAYKKIDKQKAAG